MCIRDRAAPFTAALGVTRKVDALSLVTFEGGQYSVPHELAGQPVWVRRHGEQVVITHAGPAGPAAAATTARARPPPQARRGRAGPACQRRRISEISLTSLGRTRTANRLALTLARQQADAGVQAIDAGT